MFDISKEQGRDVSKALGDLLNRAQIVKRLAEDKGTSTETFTLLLQSYKSFASNVTVQSHKFLNHVEFVKKCLKDIKYSLRECRCNIEAEEKFFKEHDYQLAESGHGRAGLMEAARNVVMPRYHQHLICIEKCIKRMTYRNGVMLKHGETVRTLLDNFRKVQREIEKMPLVKEQSRRNGLEIVYAM